MTAEQGTELATQISGHSILLAQVGMAVTGIVVGIVLFKWIRRALV